MNAQARIEPPDEITLLLGHVSAEEHEQRDRLRQCRTIASHRVLSAESGMARTLLWMVCDLVTWNLFAGLPLETLADLAKLCRRLILTAEQVEKLREAANGLD